MKIRLDDVMQSLSFPFNAVYYYYIPLETVLMFMDGMIYGKAVYGISSEEDVRKHSEDFIKLPDIGEEGRRKVMLGYINTIDDETMKKRITDSLSGGIGAFENSVREEHRIMDWYNYREKVYTEFSRQWCEQQDLELIG